KVGKMEEYRVLKSNERPEGEVQKEIPFEEPEERLVKASDAFVQLLPDDEKTPSIAYKAAELFYAHNMFEEARKRFESIVQTYPKNEVAKFATNLIVESFLTTKDWKSVEEVSARLAANKDVIDPKSDLYKDLVKFKLAGRFKLADQLMQEGKYEEAAAKYIDLVNEEPKHEFADKALNNAAVAYENTRRFDSALKLYERIFKEYPNSALADSALFRVAVNAENSYDFDKAAENYQRLVKDYPASKNREAALFNQARLLEGQQRYNEAAAAFLRYADLFPKSEDAPKNQFRAALILEKQENWKGEVQALDEFVKKFSGESGQVELVIDAKRRIAEAHQKLGNDKEARAMFAAAADEFDKKALKPDSQPIAADAAAQSRFQLAEYAFKEFDKLKIGGKGKQLENSFTAKKNELKKVNEAYKDVFKYKRLEWTLAALYRQGFALERFANTIIETPVPPDVKRLGDDAVVAYQDLLAQQTSALEDKAVESYTATLGEARKARISNEWTKKTLESLNRFRPKEFPVLKQPKEMMTDAAPFPEGLVGSAEGKVRGKVEVQKLGGEDDEK
ncbi:MAG: tetratricopeptide repeat protein, partial [Myxococcaceae bacterium]